jgi:hypothetical protein
VIARLRQRIEQTAALIVGVRRVGDATQAHRRIALGAQEDRPHPSLFHRRAELLQRRVYERPRGLEAPAAAMDERDRSIELTGNRPGGDLLPSASCHELGLFERSESMREKSALQCMACGVLRGLLGARAFLRARALRVRPDRFGTLEKLTGGEVVTLHEESFP